MRGQALGLKFRRQHPIGPYVIDFYCAGAKTGFEIDGIAHDMGSRPQVDTARDAFVAGQGIAIVRITAKDVLADGKGIAESILAFCLDRKR